MAGPAPDLLAERITAAVGAAGLGSATVAVSVRAVRTGRAVSRIRSTRPMIPASNAKLLTVAAAWERLGPDWHWQTRVVQQGTLAGGVLSGDLLVAGTGDPTISARFGGGRAAATLEQWATALWNRGLRRVTGNLLLDDSAFDGQHFHPDWPANQASRWYSAEIAALTLNDACVDLRLAPGGTRPRILADPATGYVHFDNDAHMTANRRNHQYSFWRAAGANTIRIWGKVWSKGESVPFSVPVHDPTLYFGQVLREALGRRGIALGGTVRRATPSERSQAGTLLVRHRAPLWLAAGVCLKRSQNLYAEHFCKTLGRQVRGIGSWHAGCAAVAQVLEAAAGVPAGAIALRDGSGYSRKSRVTADAIAKVLVHMGRRADAARFRTSLAIPGEAGTLDDRLTRQPYRSHVWAKTGYLTKVSALSGYARGRDGTLYAFSVLVNDLPHSARPAKRLQEAVARILVDAGR